MNNFTKEELLLIQEHICWDHDCYYPPSAKTKAFQEKILSMIENYCEHKQTENIGGWMYKCVKCGVQFVDATQ